MSIAAFKTWYGGAPPVEHAVREKVNNDSRIIQASKTRAGNTRPGDELRVIRLGSGCTSKER